MARLSEPQAPKFRGRGRAASRPEHIADGAPDGLKAGCRAQVVSKGCLFFRPPKMVASVLLLVCLVVCATNKRDSVKQSRDQSAPKQFPVIWIGV